MTDDDKLFLKELQDTDAATVTINGAPYTIRVLSSQDFWRLIRLAEGNEGSGA